jgi:hypothetical protein
MVYILPLMYPLRRHGSKHDFNQVTLANFSEFQAHLQESSGCHLQALIPAPGMLDMLGHPSSTLPLPSTTCTSKHLEVMRNPDLTLIEQPSPTEGHPNLNYILRVGLFSLQ